MLQSEESLLLGILHNPIPDLPRLVYADLLDERAEEGDAERAELIRVQVDLGELEKPIRGLTRRVHGVSVYQLRSRSHELLLANRVKWEAPWKNLKGRNECRTCPRPGSCLCLPAPDFVWRRGFIDEIGISVGQLVGTECRECDRGVVRWVSHDGYHDEPCRGCRGLGRFPDEAKELFSRFPITRVRLMEKRNMNNKSALFQKMGEFAIPELLLDTEEIQRSRVLLGKVSDSLVGYGRSLAGFPQLEGGKIW